MLCPWVLSLLVLILPACLQPSRARVFESQKTNTSNVGKDSSHETSIKPFDVAIDYRLNALSLEAKYSDIPVPLGSEPLYDFFKQAPCDERTTMFGYTNKSDLSELYTYCKTECIRLGWNFIGGMQDVESVLTFEKPDRVCSISLRPLDDANALIVMVYPKDNRSFEQYA
jgi:hypothetical protein